MHTPEYVPCPCCGFMTTQAVLDSTITGSCLDCEADAEANTRDDEGRGNYN